MKMAVTLSTFAAMVNSHGGLTFPPSRNNFHNKDPAIRANSTSFHNNGAFCTGDQRLWFNEGCWAGCPTNCSSKMPANNPKAKGTIKEFTYNTYGEPNCENYSPMEPTLPDKFRTWNIGNPSPMGDFTKYHPLCFSLVACMLLNNPKSPNKHPHQSYACESRICLLHLLSNSL